MENLFYTEEKYQTTHWWGHTLKVDQTILTISLTQPNNNLNMGVYLDKEAAAKIGKWLMEFAESK